jgi:hypothetical protein
MGKAHNKTKPRPVFEPVRIDPAAAPAEVERIPLFFIGEVEYSIPAEMDARTGLVAIRLVRERGLEAAAAYMMEESIGRDALKALINCEAATSAQIREIMANVQRMYMGDLEEMLGN